MRHSLDVVFIDVIGFIVSFLLANKQYNIKYSMSCHHSFINYRRATNTCQLRRQYKILIYNCKWSWNFKFEEKKSHFFSHNHSKYSTIIKDSSNFNFTLAVTKIISSYLICKTKNNSRKKTKWEKHIFFSEMFLLWSDFFFF